MRIIIDGYNVLKQFFGGYISAKQRAEFILHMQRYARKKGHTIIVVFDGEAEHYVDRARKVQVIYSGVKFTADDSIKESIDKYLGQDILMVSDDRELNEYASHKNVVSMGSRDFYLYVQQTLQTIDKKCEQGNVVKISSSIDPDLDDLMKSSSEHMRFKEDDLPNHDMIHKTAKKQSKINRLLLKKIEKL